MATQQHEPPAPVTDSVSDSTGDVEGGPAERPATPAPRGQAPVEPGGARSVNALVLYFLGFVALFLVLFVAIDLVTGALHF